MSAKKEAVLTALFGARAKLRKAEDALKELGVNNAYVCDARQRIGNARGEIDEALRDLREEGKVD